MAKKPQNSTTTLPRAPMPIQVQEDEDMRPMAVVVDGKSLAVESIDDRSEDEEACWADNPVVKMNYRVTLQDGQQLTIFRNMMHGGWYRAATPGLSALQMSRYASGGFGGGGI